MMGIVSDNDQKAREDSSRIINFQNGGLAEKHIPLPNLWLDATIPFLSLSALVKAVTFAASIYGQYKTRSRK
jgi:hypothetical protein